MWYLRSLAKVEWMLFKFKDILVNKIIMFKCEHVMFFSLSPMNDPVYALENDKFI